MPVLAPREPGGKVAAEAMRGEPRAELRRPGDAVGAPVADGGKEALPSGHGRMGIMERSAMSLKDKEMPTVKNVVDFDH